jgi:hypothetical protein
MVRRLRNVAPAIVWVGGLDRRSGAWRGGPCASLMARRFKKRRDFRIVPLDRTAQQSSIKASALTAASLRINAAKPLRRKRRTGARPKLRCLRMPSA